MNDHCDLEGVYALVTGATSGIRRATAGALVRRGAEVVVHGRNAERGGAVVDAITAGGAAEPARRSVCPLPGLRSRCALPVPGIVGDPGTALPRRLRRSRSLAATEETTSAGNKSLQWEDKI